MTLEAKKLPQYTEIKNLESISKKDGSGIEYEDLIGTWKFNSVWKKGSKEIDNISSSILQVLSAKLQLKKSISHDTAAADEFTHSLRVAIPSIIYRGPPP